MSRFNAILIEDEPSSAVATTDALASVGFEVAVYHDAVSALEASPEGLIDLLVLDRRLPRRVGEAPTEGTGDELLTAMLSKYPDVTTVVFSGHTSFEHHQFVTANRGVVSMKGGQLLIDRVRVFQKGQSLEFDAHVATIHAALSQLEDIQITCDEPGTLALYDKRLLRRVAFELDGTVIEAAPLAGGLTDSPVWLCRVHSESSPTAQVVAKRQRRTRDSGGFQSVCPAYLTAGTIAVAAGFCGGFVVTIQQLAGVDPIPLLELVRSDPERAGIIFASLKSGLDAMPSGQPANLPIADIADPFEHWDTVRQRAADFSIDVPPGSRIATTVRSPQHGDLHPANVLAAGESPVIIDFDSQTVGSELIDAVALYLGPIFHRDSPIRYEAWPDPAQCTQLLDAEFLEGCPAPEYFRPVQSWLRERQRSPRELYAILLAFTVRQLRYEDVVTDAAARDRAIAIVRWASAQLETQ